jgi:serine/threonine protein kinase/tetratricopeptide (TPR) repeat protein
MDLDPNKWEVAKQLFEEALDLDPSQRTRFLAQNCDDDSLRRQVAQLLLNYQQAGKFLDDPAVSGTWAHIAEKSLACEADPAELTTASSADVEDPMAGRLLGAYRLVKRIGQGGMAAVFLAVRADDAYRKEVAIKLVQPGSDRDSLLSRLRNECRTLAGLDHPNLVKLLDAGSTPEGLPFLVMDYVEGIPIDDYCDRQRLRIDDRLRLFLKVCEAVRYAHQKSVVHRDLKPSNIIVTSDGTPKLLDFGIAKVLNPNPSAQSLVLTKTGMRCMTPAYASPEQMRGKSISTASDVYSLGVVLYELLTGHRPYRLTQNTPAEAERAICEQDPEAPSNAVSRVETDTSANGVPIMKTPQLVSETREGQPEELRRRLRGDLDKIVLKTLQKEPERRYESVEGLMGDIERHLQHLPIQARRSTLAYRTSKFVQRRKIELIGFLIALLMGGGATLLAFKTLRIHDHSGGIPSTRIQSLAVLPFANLSRDPAQEYFSEGITDSLISNLSQIGPLKVISRSSTMSYKSTKKPMATIARELNVDGIIEGAVQRSGDRVRITAQLVRGPTDQELWAGSYERDLQNLFVLEREVTAVIARQVQAQVTSQNTAEARPVNLSALEAFLQGNYHLDNGSGDKEVRQAEEYFRQAIDADPTFVLAYIGLAYSHHQLLRSSTQDRVIARRSADRAVLLDPSSPEAHSALGTIMFDEWDWSGAEREFRRAIELSPNSLGHEGLCWILGIKGRLDEELKECQTAQALDPINDHLHFALEDRGDYAGAIKLLMKDTHSYPDSPFLHYFLFRDYALNGMHKESIRELEQAATLYGAPQIAANLDRAFSDSGYRGALIQWAHDFEQLHATNQIYVPRVIAEVYARLGDKDRAFYWLEQGYAHRDRIGQFGTIAYIKTDHELDPLHSDPRFEDLVRRVGLLQR